MITDLRAALALSSTHTEPPLVISESAEDVRPLIGQIRQNADAERDAFGFLPEAAYESAAQAGHLFVALRRNKGCTQLMGHILFGGGFPHLRIHQLHVPKEFRGLGIARSLIDYLVSSVERLGYMDITAKVASDLAANEVWQSLGFATVRTQPGGNTRNRTINVRVKQLDTPTLFGYPDGEPVTGLPIIGHGLTSYVPVYAIDLNVLFDLVKGRPRAEYAGQLIAAALDNMLRIVVTEEFAVELKRNFKPDAPDPIYEFALQLPTIPSPDRATIDALRKELSIIVFPERAQRNALTVQDHSDLLHLATAIFHSATGFITAEKAMVAQADLIKERYGLRIVHVKDISKLIHISKGRASTVEYRFAGKDLRISELSDSLRAGIFSIAEKINVPNDHHGQAWPSQLLSAQCRSIAVTLGGRLVCAALWDCSSRLHDVLSPTIIADEDNPAIESAMDALLLALSGEAVTNGPGLIHVAVPNAHTITREIVLSLGFTEKPSAAPGFGQYQRLALGTIVNQDNWASMRSLISAKTGNTFAEDLLSQDSTKAKVSFSAEGRARFQIALDDLETALSPALFFQSSRNFVIVPIRRSFADHLLNTSVQLSLLPTNAAAIFHERVYYSATRNTSLFSPGTILVFYESGHNNGRSAAVAVARVRETAKVSKREIASVLLRHGVLEADEIERLGKSSLVASTVFDSLIRFQRSVSLRSLREVGAIDGANLVTARRLTSTQINSIVEKGGLLEQ